MSPGVINDTSCCKLSRLDLYFYEPNSIIYYQVIGSAAAERQAHQKPCLNIGCQNYCLG